MSPDLLAERARRARPVADAPVDELVAQAEELARQWAVSLLAARALPEIADVPVQQLAREAPGLCAEISRALGSDAELAKLLESRGRRERGGVERPAALWAWIGPGGDAGAAVHDVEALRSVLWAGLLGELRDPPPGQVADLANRLAYVCASVLAAVLARRVAPSAGAGLTSPSGRRRAEQILYSALPSVPGGRPAVLIDEVAEATVDHAHAGAMSARDAGAGEQPPARARAADSPSASPAQSTGPPQAAPRARPWDTPLSAEARDQQPRRQGSKSWPAVTEPPGMSAVRLTRGAGSLVDERV